MTKPEPSYWADPHMLKLAINQGWLDSKVMLESIISIKRAGADAILSYAAKEISKEIQNI